MSNSQDAFLCYCDLSLVFYLCQIHKMPCSVIVAFLWCFIYVKTTRCHAFLLWHFLIFYLCQIHKMPCFLIVVFLSSFIYVKFTRCRALLLLSYCGIFFIFYLCRIHKMPCFLIVAFLWSFNYVKFTRCRSLLLCPFFGLLSMPISQEIVFVLMTFCLSTMPSSQDAVLCYCGRSLIFYLCQIHKMPCFLIVVFLWFLSMSSSQDTVRFYRGLSLVFFQGQYRKGLCFVLVTFSLLSMPNSQGVMLCYLGLSCVFNLCLVHKLPRIVIVAFLGSFIYVKYTRCRALLWPFSCL